MIRAVLFDLDGTLLDRANSIRAYAQDLYARHIDHFQNVLPTVFLDRFLVFDEKGYSSKDVLFKSLLDEFKTTSLLPDDLVRDFRAYFDKYCTPFPNVHSTLGQMKRQGILLGLITNGSGVTQRNKLIALNIEKYFDTVLISELEGIKKPDPAIFQRALKRLNVSPNESMFVGDHPITDIQGASALGIRAVWRKTTDWDTPSSPHTPIDDLSEILRHLS